MNQGRQPSGATVLAMRTRTRNAVLAVTLACSVLPAGCGRARRALERSPEAVVRPTERRIDAVLGRTLVVPVAIQGALNPARGVRVRLDDGRRIAAKLYWISVRAQPGEPTWGWLPPAGRWEATPADANTRPSPTGSWALVMDLPWDAVGEGLWIESERVPLNWLPDPAMVRIQGTEGPWLPPLGPLPEGLAQFVALEGRSPGRRWRQLLLTDGLAPPARE